MLFAELHGKLGRNGSRAHDRAEDLLTSTAFQLLRYLPLDVGLLAVLRRVRAVTADGRILPTAPPWLKLEGVTEAKYTFWPHWGTHGEPDVVVELFTGSQSVGRLVIEVKLDAGKSGEADTDDDEPGAEETEIEVADPDQLRKYWQGLKAQFGDKHLGVVYLTSHAIPPAEELATSITREPGDWLGWLSWRDVWATVRTRDELAARDLAAILSAKGLRYFTGFGAPERPLTPLLIGFWRRLWFREPNQSDIPQPARGFWNHGART